jgi:hypothetical protein
VKLVALHRQEDSALVEAGNLLDVGEQVAAGQRQRVDDHAFEDVELHVRQNVVDDPMRSPLRL